MKKSTKNALIGTSIALAGATVLGGLYYLTAKTLMTIALDRKEPRILTKGKEKIMGSAELSEHIAKLISASEVLENAPTETVEISSYDGLSLVGHWYPCENAKRVIVAMHGWRSSWSMDFGLIADFWHKSGCSVLYAEQRGQGGSGGDYMGFGLLERYDCFEWIKWAHNKTEGSLPIYLGGVSMGATTVLMTSGFHLPETVRGIIADCGFTSPNAIWRHVAHNNLRIPYGIYSSVADDICRQKTGADEISYSSTEALSNSTVPVLFIHGTDDKFVPIEMTYDNYKACVAPKKLFIVPGADHGMSYLVDKSGYEKALLKFWAEYDTPQI